MKKLLSAFLLAALMITAFCVSVFAADADFTGKDEFTIASYNNVNAFVKPGGKLSDLEDSTYWLIDNRGTYNVKYVSFIGRIANACQHTYAKVVTNGGGTTDDLNNISFKDPEWNDQYKNFAKIISVFKEENLPVGVSIEAEDYVSNGFNRSNLLSDYFPVESIMGEEVKYDYLDDHNFFVVIENNGTKYMVVQLELWPRAATLDWFNTVMENNPDKYAIICTPSFVDSTGTMYTMWDWAVGFSSTGTTKLRSHNMTWSGQPRDGEGLWNYAFSKHDNILAIITSRTTDGSISLTKMKNDRGNEIAVINANAGVSMNANGPTVLLTKVSADNKEITCAWSVAFKGIDEASVKSVKLNKIGTLAEPKVDDSLPQVATQYNGANSAYIFGYEGNTFRPNANMTRAEACTIFARLILGVQTIPDGYVTRFEDVKAGDWFYNAIAYLDETGYFFRNKNTTYEPNKPITRAEFVELANFASALKGNSSITFADVPTDHFYYDSIIAAAASGLVNGYEDNTFRPDNTITRAEVVTVINRLLGLKATEKTIDTTKLENEFVDIGTHWARLNILMASNSNVHGAYYYEKTLDDVQENTSEFKLENKHFSMTINKKNGKVTSFINLDNGQDILNNASSPQFIYITNQTGNKVFPTKLEKDGNRIKVTFKDGSVVYMFVEIEDNFMTFEIDSELAPGISRVTFANIITNLASVKTDDDYMLNAIGMTAWTNPVNKGYRESSPNSVLAHAYSVYDAGVMGAKLGIVFATKGESIKYLQELTDTIDPTVGLKSKAGGAYAKEWEGNFGDYALVTNVNPETIDENLKLAVELDVDQYDIHQGGNTFRQGDFVFSFTENGTAKEYYENVGKKIEAAGLKTGLHTYAYYISYGATNILSDPKWQKDLEVLETYTLRKKMTKFTRNAATVEDASEFDMTQTFFYKNSRYIVIDEEIMLVGAPSPSGLLNLTRGACGTVAAEHAVGATVKHLSGYFTMFVPVLGSDLFYHVADLTAKAYNDGGFDMIYLDAIDGLNRHTPEGQETWYYFHMFVHRIVSQCERDPIVETSSAAPQEWNVRGRTGAWDTANRSIKKFINNHIATNKSSMKNNMATTLGWFSFFPDGSPVAGLKNTIEKTIFHDDFDALGMGALLYDMSIVFNPFSVSSIRENPFHYENIKYYTDLYTKLRKSHYFTDETIEKVKAIGGEFKVIEKAPGEYAFLQMYYNAKNLTVMKDYQIDSISGSNPFASQMPFIRIESRYSTLFENPVTLVQFDENTAIGGAKITKSIANVDMTKNMAMSIRVKGTGNDGDALLFSLQGGLVSGESGGRADYFIDLNFEGWRDVILLDMDSAEYDTAKYTFADITTSGATYATYRTVANFKNMTTLTVRQCGSTAKEAQIGNLIAYTHTPAEIKNPTVSVGSSKVTFNCTMKGGEYLEYDPITGKAILYHNAEQTKEEITFSGKLEIGSGSFVATYSAEAQTEAPVRARVVIGFTGQEITN